MTEFRFEHVFAGCADDYWWAYFNEECTRQQYDAVGVRAFDLLELSDDGETVVRSIKVTPARDLPGFIRKLTGATLTYTETSTYTRSSGVAKTVVTTHTLSKRIAMSGETRLEVVDDGHVKRIFTGTIDARIPLVGKRIERAVLDDMEKSYAESAEMTQGFIDQRRAES